jgi:hypothetical protein
MTDAPKWTTYWVAYTDIDGKIPAKDGDRVALFMCLGFPDRYHLYNPDPFTRPTLRDGALWFDGRDATIATSIPSEADPGAS